MNEFGEVGIDGSLLAGNNRHNQDIYIREVPGGCMCCVAGLPMQIALNLLLEKAKPHRLLIEPTGLGHPKEIIDTLRSQYYRDVLTLNNTITLVDARKISDSRYTDHNIFNQQLEVADIIVANKTDQCNNNDFSHLLNYLKKHKFNLTNKSTKPTHYVAHGRVEPSWLIGSSFSNSSNSKALPNKEPTNNTHSLLQQPELPDCGYLSISNKGEGFVSAGWIFDSDFSFNRKKLSHLLSGIVAERLKGIFITSDGIVGFNKVDDILTEVMLDDTMDSRIELISTDSTVFEGLQEKLLSCIN